MNKISSVLLLSVAISAPVFAADQGAFIDFDLGAVGYSGVGSQFTATSFPNPHSLSAGGGYHFNQYIGVEAGHSLIGDSTIDTATGLPGVTITEKLKTSSTQVAAVGSIPMGPVFTLFGKLGLANTKVDYTATVSCGAVFNPGVNQATGTSKTNLMAGLGGQFNIGRHFGIRLQYQDLGKVQLPGQFFGGVPAPTVAVRIASVGCIVNF